MNIYLRLFKPFLIDFFNGWAFVLYLHFHGEFEPVTAVCFVTFALFLIFDVAKGFLSSRITVPDSSLAGIHAPINHFVISGMTPDLFVSDKAFTSLFFQP